MGAVLAGSLLSLTTTGEALPQPSQLSRDVAPADQSKQIALTPLRSRYTVPVFINGQGPYPFVVDTAAERTVIARELAQRLSLRQGGSVRLVTMTGAGPADTFHVRSFRTDAIGEHAAVDVPALRASDIGAMGLLGSDMLQQHAVSIDFANAVMEVRTSDRRPGRGERGDIVVSARRVGPQLVMSDAFFGKHRIRVVIDTGSQVTMGNAAFFRLVKRHHSALYPGIVRSVLGTVQLASYSVVDEVRIGDAIFQGLPVAFADYEIFDTLGLNSQPAIFLGMDALRAFEKVDIDFANAKVRFRIGPQPLHRTDPLQSD